MRLNIGRQIPVQSSPRSEQLPGWGSLEDAMEKSPEKNLRVLLQGNRNSKNKKITFGMSKPENIITRRFLDAATHS